MRFFEEVFQNHALWIAVGAWFAAQVIKTLTELIRRRRVSLAVLLSTGGMPSSHSALVTAAAASIGLIHGFDTPVFALAVIFSLVVMYDASGIRRAAGKQAKIINEMVEGLQNPDIRLEKKLKEMLGHSPLEVAAGGVLGILMAVLFS